MGRKTRIHFDGAVYHAMARGVDARDVFIDDYDRKTFVGGLARIERNTGARILAYCLMGNHFHIAVKVGPVALAAVMQRLLTAYSLAFNRRHGRTGHLFQARYKAILCLDDAYLAALIRYIHMNPVRAGMVDRPEKWPWSSLKSCAVDSTDEAQEFDPWPKGADKKVELLRETGGPRSQISELGAVISARTGITVDEMRSDSRRRPVAAAKRLLAREAVATGHTSIAVAKWLHSTPSSMTRYVQENTANTGKPDTFMKG